MQLFFIACDHEGENYDRFVSAATAERAVEIWLNTSFVRENDVRDAKVMVFRVPPVSPVELAHDWHTGWERRGLPLILEKIV